MWQRLKTRLYALFCRHRRATQRMWGHEDGFFCPDCHCFIYTKTKIRR